MPLKIDLCFDNVIFIKLLGLIYTGKLMTKEGIKIRTVLATGAPHAGDFERNDEMKTCTAESHRRAASSLRTVAVRSPLCYLCLLAPDVLEIWERGTGYLLGEGACWKSMRHGISVVVAWVSSERVCCE